MMSKFLFRKTNAIVLSILTFTLCACASPTIEAQAALLSANSKQARSEIIKLVRQSLGNKNIPIAENVFQDSSRLLLGKTSVTSPEGISVIRADNESTIVFELVKRGEHCLLRRLNTTQEWVLSTKSCVKR